MTRPKHAPVESFGPELMASLLKAATGSFTLQMPWRRAIRLRQRLYRLRTSMLQVKHPKYTLVSRVTIVIDPPMPLDKNTLCTVTFRPNDSEFASDLTNAGVTLSPEPEHEPEEEKPTPTQNPTPPQHKTNILEELLKDIKT